jgi:transposase
VTLIPEAQRTGLILTLITSCKSVPDESTDESTLPHEGNQLSRMAPNLPESSHQMIRNMIISKCKNVEIAKAVRCSRVTVRNIRLKLHVYGNTRAPPNGGGRKRSITPPMLDALRDYLQKRPGSYHYEMKDFLQKEFEVPVTTSSIGRALASIGWTKKKIRRVAKGRNADLRDLYLHNISEFSPKHFVFVDESGCDRRAGSRRTGWAPLGVTPTEVAALSLVLLYWNCINA